MQAELFDQETEIRSVVRDLLASARIEAPPVDLERVAKLRGIEHIRERDMARYLGTLRHERKTGVTVTLNAKHPLKRRFTLAHEIAHTLIEPLSTAKPVLAHRKPRGANAREQLCDEIAAELLMPSDMLVAEIDGRPVGIDLIRHIASTFEASLQSSAVRLGDLEVMPAQVVFWHRNGPYGLKATLNAGPEYLTGKGTSGVRVLSNQKSPIARAFGSSRCEVGFELPRPDEPWNAYRCEAQGFMQGPRRFVLSVATPAEQAA